MGVSYLKPSMFMISSMRDIELNSFVSTLNYLRLLSGFQTASPKDLHSRGNPWIHAAFKGTSMIQ